MRTPSGLWDDAVDGGSLKPSKKSRPGRRWAFWLMTCACSFLLLFAVLTACSVIDDIMFQSKLSAVNQRAKRLGGGVSNGRRHFRYHVGAWFHGGEITDQSMPQIISIIRDCQSRGLGGAHLSLSLDRTRVGDNGIALLRDVVGLESVSLRETKVTKEGVDSLQKSLRDTQIDAWPISPLNKAHSRGEPTP
jgi:hypothetical protein